MNRRVFKAAVRLTLPVLAGYLAIGMAFGLMLEAAGYGFLWALFMSLVIYAGSGQYLGVELLSTGAALAQAALLTFLINFRHVVYGISMLEKFRGMGFRKPYMIFSLTDETYALLSSVEPPDALPPKKLYFCIALLNHLYWITGSVLGSVCGALIGFDTRGVEFAMTALFIVIAVEQWKSTKNHIPVFIGGGVTIIARVFLGGYNMLLPALFAMTALLLFFRKKLEPPVTDGGERSAVE